MSTPLINRPAQPQEAATAPFPPAPAAGPPAVPSLPPTGYPAYPMYPQPPPGYGGAYPPYYGPPPYPVAFVPVRAPGQQTFTGLRFLRYGVYAMILANLFTALSLFLLIGILATLADAMATLNIGALMGALGTLQTASMLGNLGVLASIAGGVVGLVGVYFMTTGQHEFGPAHGASLARAKGLVGLSCGIFVVLGLAQFTMGNPNAAAMGGMTAPDFQAMVNQMATAGIVIGALSLAGAVAAGLAMVSLTSGLTGREGAARKAVFLVAGIASGALALVVGLMIPSIFGNVPLGGANIQGMMAWVNQMMNGLRTVSMLGVLSCLLALASLAAYNGVLRVAEEGAHRMIASQSFDPNAAVWPR